uniref:porphobilinogen synthase n=1 Tax=Nelumbo nucifera TaxID=4432 RepID=A0A822YRA8_NELNU|nr:TPA_asm: hypothetical protein HUJ06_005792 [Nelumbo nucifera]
MIKAGGALKMVDEEKVMMESLMCLRLAGADIILTYFCSTSCKMFMRREEVRTERNVNHIKCRVQSCRHL